ncbi:MAG: ABC transporter substrate-binding protein [Acidobacteria bacterium]|nr:ABC transporter substrate-binding protein [Acidobacteriota bacterium]
MTELKEMISLRRPLKMLLLVAVFSCLLACRSAPEPSSPSLGMVLRTGSFTFPALASVIAPIIKAKGYDRAHGFTLEIVQYGNVSSYYGGLVVGEVDMVPGGPHVFQRMRSEGVPVQITNTYATLASLVVIARDPTLQGIRDLRGKRLAADMSSSEFHILRLISQSEGIDLTRDVSVLQAVPSVARAHLQGGQADAILTFEPTATLTLRDNPGYRIVVNGAEAWRKVGLEKGWLLASIIREDWIGRNPGGVERWISALRDAAAFIEAHPEEADSVVSKALNLPTGVFLQALKEGRIRFDVRQASEEEKSLTEMFAAAVASGYVKYMPKGAIYRLEPPSSDPPAALPGAEGVK